MNWITVEPGCQMPDYDEVFWAIMGGRPEGAAGGIPDYRIELLLMHTSRAVSLDCTTPHAFRNAIPEFDRYPDWYNDIKAWCKYEDIKIPENIEKY